jgi:hypothetical protein
MEIWVNDDVVYDVTLLVEGVDGVTGWLWDLW